MSFLLSLKAFGALVLVYIFFLLINLAISFIHLKLVGKCSPPLFFFFYLYHAH
ncbi:hypothetical protein BD560DRAFT_395081 [Blakeslea trispora]|nr:hypothetical protein BD560DRAFT_395081 [Blakeslea trispora]